MYEQSFETLTQAQEFQTFELKALSVAARARLLEQGVPPEALASVEIIGQ